MRITSIRIRKPAANSINFLRFYKTCFILTGGEMSSSINPSSGIASMVPGMATSIPGTATNIGRYLNNYSVGNNILDHRLYAALVRCITFQFLCALDLLVMSRTVRCVPVMIGMFYAFTKQNLFSVF